MGSSRNSPSFSETFEVHHAIEVVVLAAFRTRSNIDVAAVVAALRATFPDHSMSDAEFLVAVTEAAARADVPSS